MIKRVQYIILFLLATGFASAENVKTDSLLQVFLSDTNDSLRCLNAINLSRSYTFDNPDSTRYYARLAIDLARKLNFCVLEKQGYLVVGRGLYRLGDYEEALKILQTAKSLPECSGDQQTIAHVVNIMGLINWKNNQFKLALEQFQQVYEWSEELQDNDLYKYALNNIGLLNANQQRYDIAMNYFSRLHDFAKKYDDSDALALVYINRGNVYLKTENYQAAEADFLKYIAAREKSTSYDGITVGLIHLGHLYLEEKKFDLADKQIDRAIRYCEKYQMNQSMVECLALKAAITIGKKNYLKARNYAKEGLALSDSINYSFPGFYILLGDINAKLGRYEEAYRAQKKLKILQDSLITIDKDREFAALEISFQSKEKEAENAILLKGKEIRRTQLRKKSIIILMVGAVLILLLILAAQLLRMRKKDHKIKFYLKKEVQERTKELDTINQQLISSNTELKRFAHIASHDLKEPLRSISGFISLIKRKGENLSEEDFQEYFGFIEKSSLQMADLVDSILQYSKLDAIKEVTKESTDLTQIIEDLKILMLGSLQENKIQIIYENLPTIQYYPYVIKTVLKNLIENGIKYNDSKPPIIKITTEQQQDDLLIYIEDNGIGIHPDYHQKIFTMFTRLHNRKVYSGSGMGLAFCKKILSKNNGDISVGQTTTEGSGSTFVVTLKSVAAEYITVSPYS